MQIKLLKVGNGTSTLKPPFKSPFYRCHFQVLPYWGVSSEFCHMIINTLLRFVLKSYLKCFTHAIDDWFSLIAFICFILFCIVNKVKILQDFLVSCSREDIVNANVTYEMIKMRIHWYAWQLVYRQYVIDTNESFHFLDTGKKVLSVLL